MIPLKALIHAGSGMPEAFWRCRPRGWETKSLRRWLEQLWALRSPPLAASGNRNSLDTVFI